LNGKDFWRLSLTEGYLTSLKIQKVCQDTYDQERALLFESNFPMLLHRDSFLSVYFLATVFRIKGTIETQVV